MGDRAIEKETPKTVGKSLQFMFYFDEGWTATLECEWRSDGGSLQDVQHHRLPTHLGDRTLPGSRILWVGGAELVSRTLGERNRSGDRRQLGESRPHCLQSLSWATLAALLAQLRPRGIPPCGISIQVLSEELKGHFLQEPLPKGKGHQLSYCHKGPDGQVHYRQLYLTALEGGIEDQGEVTPRMPACRTQRSLQPPYSCLS